jgi:hypothetical protein
MSACKQLSVTWAVSKGFGKQSMTKRGWNPSGASQMVVSSEAIFWQGRLCQNYFVKYFSKSSCDRFAPASVNMTDFAFVAGSEM